VSISSIASCPPSLRPRIEADECGAGTCYWMPPRMPRSSTARWPHGVAERYLRPAQGLDLDDPAAVPSTALSAVAWWCSAGSTAVGRARVSTGSLVRRVTSWTTQSGKRVEHVSELPVALTVRKGELLPPDVPVAGHRGHRVRPHRHAHRAEPVRLAARERPQAVDDTGAPVPIALWPVAPADWPSSGHQYSVGNPAEAVRYRTVSAALAPP